MSYILDALKKSDEQRMASLSESPVQLATPRMTHRSRTGRFVLLAVACLIAGGWLFTLFQRDQIPPQPALKTEAPINPALQNAPASMMPVSQPRKVIKPDPARPHVAQKTSPAPMARHTVVALSREQSDAAPVQAPVAEKQAMPAASIPAASVPLRADLPVNIQQSLPSIHIEGHIYDANPSSRMVIINGHVHREGQRLNNGAALEEITEHGIILNYQGTRFRMGVFDH